MPSALHGGRSVNSTVALIGERSGLIGKEDRRWILPMTILVLLGGCEAPPSATSPRSVGNPTSPEVTWGDQAVGFEHLGRLGAFDGPGMLEETPLDVIVDHHGRVIVTVAAPTTPAIFDTAGWYRGRLGDEGEGPGEFLWPSELEVDRQGSLLVLDGRLQRVNVFDSTLTFVGSHPWRARSGAWLLLPDGRFFTNSSNPTPTGSPSLHVVNDGQEVIAFGQQATTSSRRSRALAHASKGGVWAAHERHYQVDRWSFEGVLLDSITRTGEWPTEGGGSLLGNPRQPPRHSIRDIREDGEGRLWVVAWRPRDDWNQAWRDFSDRIRGGEVRGNLRPSYGDLFVTQIDVLDPETGGLVAIIEWAEIAHGFAGDSLLATLSEDEIGVVYVDLWRLSLGPVGDSAG